MKKIIYAIALLAAVPAFQSCIDDTESLSVKEVREKKAEQLQSIIDLNKAEAEAKALIAEAEAEAKKAEAQMSLAQAELLKQQAELVKVEAELRAVEVEIANTQLDIEKQNLLIKEQELLIKQEELRMLIAQNNYDIAALEKKMELLEEETNLALKDLANQMQQALIDELELQIKYNDAIAAKDDYEANRAKAQLSALMAAYQSAASSYYDALAAVNSIKSQQTTATYGWTNMQTAHTNSLNNNEELTAQAQADLAAAEAQLAVAKEYVENNGGTYQDMIDSRNEALQLYTNAVKYTNNASTIYTDAQKALNSANWNLQNSYYYEDGFYPFIQYAGFNSDTTDPVTYGYIARTPVTEENGVYTYSFYASIEANYEEGTDDDETVEQPETEEITLFTVSYTIKENSLNLVPGVDYGQGNQTPNDWSGSAGTGLGSGWTNPYEDNQLYSSYLQYVDYYTPNTTNIEKYLDYVNTQYNGSGSYYSIWWYQGRYDQALANYNETEEAMQAAKAEYDEAFAALMEAYNQGEVYYTQWQEAVDKYDTNYQLYWELYDARAEARSEYDQLNSTLENAQDRVDSANDRIDDLNAQITDWKAEIADLEKIEKPSEEDTARIEELQGKIAENNELIAIYQGYVTTYEAVVEEYTPLVAAADKAKKEAEAAFDAYKYPSGTAFDIVSEYRSIFNNYINGEYYDAYKALYYSREDEDGNYVQSIYYTYLQYVNRDEQLPRYYSNPSYQVNDEGVSTDYYDQDGWGYLEDAESWLASAEEDLDNAQNNPQENSRYTILANALKTLEAEATNVAALVKSYNEAAADKSNSLLTYRQAQISQSAAWETYEAWNKIVNEANETGNVGALVAYYESVIEALESDNGGTVQEPGYNSAGYPTTTPVYVQSIKSIQNTLTTLADQKVTIEQNFVKNSQSLGFTIEQLNAQLELAQTYLDAAEYRMNQAKAELEAAIGSDDTEE